jgi:hypothetical protein
MSSWSSAIPILNPHQSLGAGVTGSPYVTDMLGASLQLYVVGGSGDSGDVEAQTNPYRLGTGLGPHLETWNPAASLLTPRFGHAVSVGSDRQLYAIGGRSNPGAALLKSVEAYTPPPSVKEERI